MALTFSGRRIAMPVTGTSPDKTANHQTIQATLIFIGLNKPFAHLSKIRLRDTGKLLVAS